MIYKNKFCTVINCIDGRVQLPVINFLKNYFDAEFVDSITEPGPIKIMTERKSKLKLESIYNKINISLDKHNSVGMGVVGHFNCAGNPVSKDKQIEQIKKSVLILKKTYPNINIIGLWVNRKWEVSRVNT